MSAVWMDHSNLTVSDRWTTNNHNGSLLCGWSGASIAFLFSGSSLFVKFGHRTQRTVDNWNGGTPMVLVSSKTPEGPENIKTFDASSGEEVVILDGKRVAACLVRIVLIDWASLLEIDHFITSDVLFISVISLRLADDIQDCRIEPVASNPKVLQVLVIGDLIACGLAPDIGHETAIPMGSLDGLYFQAQHLLIHRNPQVDLALELVAYPGSSLTESLSEDNSTAMFSLFFQSTPWERTAWKIRGSSAVIVIALGTNDDAQDIGFEEFCSTLQIFIKKLQLAFPSVEQFWVMLSFEDFTDDEESVFRQQFLSLAGTSLNFGTDVIRFFDLQAGLRRHHTSDGLHPNIAGHRLLGKNFADILCKTLDISV
ncbi:hypothetical protein C8J56DRAFT_482578 [Mycena floridula]|nr:hypothetical protein C8J56DRAFT_482578 [Mycena floridula]